MKRIAFLLGLLVATSGYGQSTGAIANFPFNFQSPSTTTAQILIWDPTLGTGPAVRLTTISTGLTYTSGTNTLTATAGGTGTVTSFSAGDLSPIFTTTEATVTTTPALSFSLSTAAAHTFLGNNTGSTAAPAYVAVSDADLSTTNITTNNATTSKHGFLPTLDNNTAHFLNGQGGWTTPAGGSGTVTNPSNLTTNAVALGGANGTTDIKTIAGITTDGTSKLTVGTSSNIGTIDLKSSTGTTTLQPLTTSGTTTLSLPNANGTLALASSITGVIGDTIWDTKGDLAVATAADTAAKLAVGTANQVLTVDSSTATGLKWATPGAGTGTLTATGLSLPSNSIVLGNTYPDTKAVAGITTDGSRRISLGVATTTVGQLEFFNATSGSIVLQPQTGALASGVITIPTEPSGIMATQGWVATANTTGSARSLSISGQTGLLSVTGLTSTNRIKTVRDAADTILELGGNYTPTGTWTSLTMVTPVLGTPTSGTLTNCTGLPVAGITASTTQALGVGSIELGHATDTTIARSAAGAVTIEGVPVLEAAPRTTTSATGNTTPTPNCDTTDLYIATGMTVNMVFGAPTGTPAEGQKLMVRIKGTAARTLSFNAVYRFSTDLVAPTTTVTTKTLYMGFIWNANDSTWDNVAQANNY